MTGIEAIIGPRRLDVVLEALRTPSTTPGVTVSPVRGFGRIVGRVGGSGSADRQFEQRASYPMECRCETGAVRGSCNSRLFRRLQ